MKEIEFQFKSTKFILISNVILFGLIFVYYFLHGFTDSEMKDLLKTIVPIESIYMTACLKFLIENKNVKASEKKSGKTLNSLYLLASQIVLFGHIILLTIIISLKAFGKIDMEQLNNFIPILETFFGIYAGIIISDLFQKRDKPEVN